MCGVGIIHYHMNFFILPSICVIILKEYAAVALIPDDGESHGDVNMLCCLLER